MKPHLREALLEIVVQDVGAVGEDGQGGVVPHAVGGLRPLLRHALDDHLAVLLPHAVPRLQPQHVRRVHLGALQERAGLQLLQPVAAQKTLDQAIFLR